LYHLPHQKLAGRAVDVADGDAWSDATRKGTILTSPWCVSIGHIGARSPGTGAHAGQQRVAHGLQRRAIEAVGRCCAVCAVGAVHIGRRDLSIVHFKALGFGHWRRAICIRAGVATGHP
jgi:hypothetical protein